MVPNPWLFLLSGVFLILGFTPFSCSLVLSLTEFVHFCLFKIPVRSFLLHVQYFITPRKLRFLLMRHVVLYLTCSLEEMDYILHRGQLFNFLISLVHPNLTSIL